MDFQDLKIKNEKDLHELLGETREQIRELRFKVSEKQAKNVRTLRELKKTVAKILTLLKQRQQKPVVTK